MADDILAKTGYDLAKFPAMRSKRIDPKTKVFDIAVRAKRLDEVVHRFVGNHADAVVLELGAGLDTRIFRVDPPPTVDWYDVDFPEVIALRKQVVPAHPNVHAIGADLTNPEWMTEVPADRPTVIVADGLVAFLSQDSFVSLLDRLVNHFHGGELAFNLYTTWAVWATKHLRSLAAIGAGVVNPGFNDPRMPERWAPGLKIVEEIFLTRAPELAEMPLASRLSSRLVASSATMSRMVGTVILRYHF
jgi:O-methyltransferase involved in polyketide biosynthesis